MNEIKEKYQLKYLTGAHPEVRALCRGNNRPTEFGNKVWATSLVLIDYLETKPFELQNLKVLEIGCGWGLIGVYLAKTFNCEVTCSDFDEKVLPIVDLHAKLNNVQIKTKRAAFSDLTPDFLKDFDLIIGAEVCYSQEVVQDILVLTGNAFAGEVQKIIIADPGRPRFHRLLRILPRTLLDRAH